MSDPFYRTPSGFRTLIEREWVMAGHKFATYAYIPFFFRSQRADESGRRLALVGNKDREAGRAPVFLQFLDACYQVLTQVRTLYKLASVFDHSNSATVSRRFSVPGNIPRCAGRVSAHGTLRKFSAQLCTRALRGGT